MSNFRRSLIIAKYLSIQSNQNEILLPLESSLYEKGSINGGTGDNSDSLSDVSRRIRSKGFFEIKPNTEYILERYSTHNVGFRFYKSNYEFESSTQGTVDFASFISFSNNKKTFTTNSDVAYFRVLIGNSNSSTSIELTELENVSVVLNKTNSTEQAITLANISATKTNTTYNLFGSISDINTDDISVIGTYSDGTTENLTSISTFDVSSVDMNKTGTNNIAVKSIVNNITKTTTVEISITDEYLYRDTFTSLEDTLIYVLTTSDTALKDVSGFKATFSTYKTVRDNLQYGDYYMHCNCATGLGFQSVTSGSYISTVTFVTKDLNYINRVNNIHNIISTIKSKCITSTSDLEKALMCHDYIVKNVVYNSGVTNHSNAGYVLYNNAGICGGYAYAMIVLLHELGINSYYVSSTTMNHGWTIVELDGQNYHLDCTWDRTRSRTSGQIDRLYFLHSTSNFESSTTGMSRHYSWSAYDKSGSSSSVECTSTLYDNWFVHSIIGDMTYDNGFWYYEIDGINYKSKIDGTEKEIV